MVLFSKERIKTGKGTFSFSGTALNSGNNPFSSSGVNSSELTLDLTNNSAIPNKAIVTSVTTSGTQSPNQGNVHHMICPYTKPSIWYTSTLSSATKGRYTIANNIDAKQVWKFKYNALATAKSTMKNVTLTLEWEYDLKNTDYKY